MIAKPCERDPVIPKTPQVYLLLWVISSLLRFPLFYSKEFGQLKEALEKLEKIKIVVDSVRNGKEEINKYFLSN
jgi:hypothetical protein